MSAINTNVKDEKSNTIRMMQTCKAILLLLVNDPINDDAKP
jgi:hypothetical protein